MCAAIKPQIVVVDPSMRSPELDSFNGIQMMSNLPCTLYLPALFPEVPLPELSPSIKGIIILGSLASVHDRLPWQYTLEKWLQPAIDCDIPILGICYGHQMLSYMFGGQVAYISPTQHKLVGARECEVDLNDFKMRGRFSFVVSHNQAVITVPSDFNIIATSNEIRIDGIKHKNKPIYGIQAHPEATELFLKSRGIYTYQGMQAFEDGKKLMTGFLNFVTQS